MMASNFNPDPPTAPGSDSDGRPDNTTADTDPHEDMDKEPSDLSGCRSGNNFVPEDEIFYEGETAESKSNKCTKHPGHENFIPVRDFTMDHLPEDQRTKEVMREIKTLIHQTVHIRVNYTSKERPDTYDDKRTSYPARYNKGTVKSRTGTGYFMPTGTEPKSGVCPCRDCKKSGKPQTRYWKYRVVTATHVVYDDDEARETDITCFYDSKEQNEDVVKLYGVGLDSTLSQEERLKTDVCYWLVCVTHDEQSAQKLNSGLLGWRSFSLSASDYRMGIIVSHPHGGPKMVSLGNILDVTFRIKPGDDRSHKLPEDTICRVPSDPTGELVPLIIVGPGLKVLSYIETERYLKGATYTVPDDAKYFVRIDFKKDGFTFPPGTTFHSKDGTVIKTRDGTTIPDNAVFRRHELKPFYPKINNVNVPRHISYDIPTCPGSSGAHVPMPILIGILLLSTAYGGPHAGSCGGCNLSCSFNLDIGYKIKEDSRKYEV